MPTPAPPRTATPVIGWDRARRLAERHGTPLHVVSRPALAAGVRAFAERLPGVRVHYAAKANRAHEILSHLQFLGAALDVCTPGEVKAGLAAGFSPARMIHTHPCKTDWNLARSHALGVRTFVYDTADELPKFARLAPDADLLLRVAAHGGAVIDLSKKFGCPPAHAPALLAAARSLGLSVRGLSFHLGSQCLDPAGFGPVLAGMRDIFDRDAAAGGRMDTLDIGGGPPAPYRDPAALPALADYLAAVKGHLDAHFGDLRLRLLAEPGRCLVAEAVTAVVRVVARQVRGDRTWYFIDDGIYGTFSDRDADRCPYPVLAEAAARRPSAPCVLAGQTCDSLDIVWEDRHLPADLEVGELLLVPSVGAYTLVSATTFNGFDPPAVVAVDHPPPT